MSRVFRLFVSSTFADLQAERHALQTFVFPRLRELCAAAGARFQAVDLRWGISQEAGDDQQTLAICLREVRRCQQLTPRPNFLILAGERYGWRPLPPDIPIEDFPVLEAAIADPADREFLRTCYRRDDNAVPPHYLLQRGAAEPLLARLLRDAVARLRWPPGRSARYLTSATEREIEDGALTVPDADEHVLCLLRRIDGLPRAAGPASAYLDLAADGSIDADAARLVEDLRSRLRGHLRGNARDITAVWSSGGPGTEHLGDLPEQLEDCLPLLDRDDQPTTVCDAVWRHLGGIIRAACARDDSRSPREVERDAHAGFRDERAAVVAGRASELARIAAYLGSTEPAPLAVLGDFGSGKSALMARAAVEAGGQPNVVHRFVGATAASTSGVRLLGGIGAEVAALFGVVVDPPAGPRDLTGWFPEQLARASADRPLVVFIDALDQLAGTDAARTLAWLPHELPPGVRMVVSAAPGAVTDVLQGRQPASAIVRLAPLPVPSGAAALDEWLRADGRTLQPDQRDAVLASFARGGLPLQLRLAFEEARRWRSFEPGTELADDPRVLIRLMVERLAAETRHGRVLTERALGYLAAARHGMTEDELLDVLSADDVVRADLRRRFPKSPVTDRVPDVVWSRLFDDLEPYLTTRDTDGTATLGFFHRQLADVAVADLVRTDRYGSLADYFASRPDRRRLTELPWSLAHARRWDQFVGTVVDFAFLDARLRGWGPQEVIDDLDLALEAADRRDLGVEATGALSTLRAFLRLVAHILSRDPAQFAGQLRGRVEQGGNPLIDRLLAQAGTAGPGSSLQPAGRTLAAPGGDLIATLAGHAQEVRAVGVTPDGTLGVSASADGTVRVWDLDRQVERFIIPVGHGEVNALVVTPNGRQAVSGSADGSIDVWDLASGALVRRWQGPRPWRTLVLTPDGTRLISGTNGPAVLWDFATGEQLSTIASGSRATTVIAISADARRAIIGGVYDFVSLMDLESGEQVAELGQGRDSWVSAVAMTHDGRRALSADWEGRIKVWDFDARHQVGQLGGHGYHKITSLAVTGDGDVLSADDAGRLILQGEKGGPRKVVSTTGHRVQQMAVTPDGRRVITAGGDGTLRVWDLTPPAGGLDPRALWGSGSNSEADDRRSRETWRGVHHAGSSQAPAPPVIDVGTLEPPTGWWRIWPTRYGSRNDDDEDEPVGFRVVDRDLQDRSPEIVTGRCRVPPALSHRGELLAAVLATEGDPRLAVYEVATGIERWSCALTGPGPLAFSADDRMILCAGEDHVGTWDTATGAENPKAVGPVDPRFTPDGGHLLALAPERFVGLWRVGEADPVVRWPLPANATVGFAPDGGRAWWSTRDGRLWHWTVGPPGSFGRPVSLPAPAPILRVSVDGRFAVARTDDSRVRVWRLPGAQVVVDRVVPDARSVAIGAARLAKGARLRGLLAIGSSRLEVFDLATTAWIAAFDGDAAVTRCRFEGGSVVVMSTENGSEHRLMLHPGSVE
ncbi:hypothetical protein Ate02nite_63150 [Paractinoplanes tereljensis]|uniref:WD40 repeat protein n=1 Tax=Paractinoplanes tereljensis TaxID=571912 RepID=A0A919TWT5_9ACTN|nr:DUF4062 domain-containing protein [Actinoplanes tereljensis]GIF23585.1 hypothetical protein Ate02nite_63150 [Actinoplanes tereljensis]